MENLNLKPHFFEMIVEEPMLQIKIAALFQSQPETIEEFAREQHAILARTEIRQLIANHYNECMPPGLEVSREQTLNRILINHL
jgi:hypothetical protein